VWGIGSLSSNYRQPAVGKGAKVRPVVGEASALLFRLFSVAPILATIT